VLASCRANSYHIARRNLHQAELVKLSKNDEMFERRQALDVFNPLKWTKHSPFLSGPQAATHRSNTGSPFRYTSERQEMTAGSAL
jgi:hypothetical protein